LYWTLKITSLYYRSPRVGSSLGCWIIIIFGRSPFGRCHILGILLKILFFTAQKIISLKFRHLFFWVIFCRPCPLTTVLDSKKITYKWVHSKVVFNKFRADFKTIMFEFLETKNSTYFTSFLTTPNSTPYEYVVNSCSKQVVNSFFMYLLRSSYLHG
jgi:hypothetical protein